MNRRIMILLTALAVGLGIGLLGGVAVRAQSMSDYASTPPFVFQAATPNILLLLDNSRSMNERVVGAYACGNDFNPNAPNPCFSPETSYAGYLDSLRCYVYDDDGINHTVVNDIGNERFTANSTKARVGARCGTEEWDGNLLNFIMFRRLDALKKAMIGGICSREKSLDQLNDPFFPDVRGLDGACPPIGNPAQVTFQNHREIGAGLITAETILLYRDGNPLYNGFDGYIGRVPDSVSKIPGGDYVPKLYIGLQTLRHNGFFCVDDDNSGDVNGRCDLEVRSVPDPDVIVEYDVLVCDEFTAEDCIRSHTEHIGPITIHSSHLEGRIDPDPFTERQFNMRWVAGPDPKGVIQQVGAKARLGLMEFMPDSLAADGSLVRVGIGSSQVVGVAPVNTNTAAMVHAVEGMRATTQTPLGEALYVASRYVAQIGPDRTRGFNYPADIFTYPIGFPDANVKGFRENGLGSPGPTEQSALGVTETCPAGYLPNACGRDPLFHGSAWATPSAIVHCCQTFIVLVTDGAPTLDENIPDGLKEYASTRLNLRPCRVADGTCHTDPATPASTLLQEHRTDHDHAGHYLDDVALWAHTVDLRPDNGNPDPRFACNGTIPKIKGIDVDGHCLADKQTITLYTFYAFGDISGRELLMQAARQGGFVDSHPPDSSGDLLPDSGGTEWDKVINSTGLLPTASTRVPGCNADCIPDNYFESSNVNDLQERLLATLFSILRRSSSGTSVSAQTTSTSGQGAAYQAYFFPSTAGFNPANEVTWTGYTQALFVDQFGNLREDTDGDGKLTLSEDLIIKFRFDDTAQPPKTVVDKYKDSHDGIDGTGTAGPRVATGVDLAAIKPIWEAGRQLALRDAENPRKIFTWADRNNNGQREASEWLSFTTDAAGTLCPFLGGVHVAEADCKADGDIESDALKEATGIINFIRGEQVSGLRDRQVKVDGQDKTWKLGDVMHATPVVVGAPRERYDVIYGDPTYAAYFIKHKDRRQVVYVGANDGMLHAFNAGFFMRGPRSDAHEELSFCTTLNCDAQDAAPKLGAELWAYIPQDVLPQLRWLTRSDYSHIYYVDLKPKVTDARIFTPDENHPGGWGTILIGGFRMGGSCANCPATRGGSRVVTANFNGTTESRVFLSSYFVMDITDPETPVLLWTFRDQDLGFTTAVPAVFRVNNVSGASSTDEKWYAVFGTGPTHYDGSSTQFAQMFTVDLKLGPNYISGSGSVNRTTGTDRRGRACSSAKPCIIVDTDPTSSAQLFSPATPVVGFMGDAVTVDYNLDYRMDVVYAGSISCAGLTPSPCNGSNPIWKGAMWRLTLNSGESDRANWGFESTVGGARAFTALISTFAFAEAQAGTCAHVSPCDVGPVVAAPAITTDGDNNLWVYFGTGRFYSNQDNITTDLQHFFGIKDIVISHGDLRQDTERNHLKNVSNIKVCLNCATGANVSTDGGNSFSKAFTGGTDSLIDDVKNVDGWFVTLRECGIDPCEVDEKPRERIVSSPVVFGGFVFFASYGPPNDSCGQGGSSRLYALFSQSGTGSPQAALGTTSDSAGRLLATETVKIGHGLAQVAVNYESSGPGNPGPGQGCSTGKGWSAGMSHGGMEEGCLQGTKRVWSAIINWRDI